MTNQFDFTWQELLKGSQKLNQMKQEIDDLLSMLRGFAKKSGTSPGTRMIRILLFSWGSSREYLEFLTPENSHDTHIFIRTLNNRGEDVKRSPALRKIPAFSASELTPREVIVVRDKLQELLTKFAQIYTAVDLDMAEIAAHGK